jgi:hypothetical protein
VRHGVKLAAIDAAQRHAHLLGLLEDILDLLGVRIVPHEHDFESSLPSPQGGENGLSPFHVFHG